MSLLLEGGKAARGKHVLAVPTALTTWAQPPDGLAALCYRAAHGVISLLWSSAIPCAWQSETSVTFCLCFSSPLSSFLPSYSQESGTVRDRSSKDLSRMPSYSILKAHRLLLQSFLRWNSSLWILDLEFHIYAWLCVGIGHGKKPQEGKEGFEETGRMQ